MKELIIDTATNLLVVGLKIDEKAIIKTRLGKNDNAAYLVNYIKELLDSENINLKDLDNIIVGIGPGSYTGLRVSVVVAKTLAHFNNINLKTISSLILLSSGYLNPYALIDARRGYYFANLHKEGKTITSDLYLSLSEISDDYEKVILDEKTIKIDLNVISNNAKIITNILDLEPNYLRKTEAEVNHDQRSNNK